MHVHALRTLAVTFGVLLAFAIATPAFAAANYTFVSLDYPGAVDTKAYGINDAGQIVGIWKDASLVTHGFVRSANGSFTPFDYPGADATLALGINGAGQVAGGWLDYTGHWQSFVRNADGGTFWSFGEAGATDIVVYGINGASQVVGQWQDASDSYHGFVRSADSGIFTSIDYPESVATGAFGINDAGQVVGSWNDWTAGKSHGFLRSADGSSLTSIDYPDAGGTDAFGINDAGQIVGSWHDSVTYHGFVRSADGSSFTSFDYPGAASIEARGINNAGQIVGTWTDAADKQHGFIGTPVGTLMGTVTDATTGSPIPGASVDAGAAGSFVTGPDGTYTFTDVPAAGYTVVCSKAGYVPVTVDGVVVTAGATTVQDFALTPTTAAQDAEDLVDAVDEAVAAGALTGSGRGKSASGKLGAFENMVATAEASIATGDYASALDQLTAAYAKCDGDPLPPDLVTGPAREAIAAQILALITKLEAMMP